MPVRRRLQASQQRTVDAVSAFRWSVYGDGLDHLLGEPHFGTRREAERAWPVHRAALWADSPVGRVPKSAQAFDGLTEDGLDLLMNSWNHSTFPASAVRDALRGDRERLALFEATSAAGPIADFLQALRRSWDVVDATAEDFGRRPALARTWPSGVITGATYGSLRLDARYRERAAR